MNEAVKNELGKASIVRAWVNLVRHSWQRQARAHLMVWIAAGLMLFLTVWVLLISSLGAWDIRTWRRPFRSGLTYEQWAVYARFAPPEVLTHKPQPGLLRPQPRMSEQWAKQYQERTTTVGLADEVRPPPPPMTFAADPVRIAISGAYTATLENEEFRRQVAFVSFSRVIVFNIFTTFLLPLCSLSFATEALGREREQGNLLWTLTRPLQRWQIYLAKYVAVLPWCLALNLGGFALICFAAGGPGGMALAMYWPAILLGTLAFAALFHLMGAVFRRPAVVAILYAFFLETVMGNLPGHLKRGSISFYVRSMMYDSASVFQLQPDRPLLYSPVSGPTAVVVLTMLTVVLLGAGMWVFSRAEYLNTA